MPKICQPKTCNGVSHYRIPTTPVSVSERKHNVSHCRPHHSLKYSSPIKVNCNHYSHDFEQNVIWHDEAVRRASGRSTLQQPIIDRLQCRGRTIYDVQHTTMKPKQETHRRLECPETPTPSTSKVRRYRSRITAPNSGRRRSLINESLDQTENGKALRNISPVFALGLFTEDQEDDKSWLKPLLRGLDNEIYLAEAPAEKNVDTRLQSGRRLSIPCLTWSDSPADDSDGEGFPVQPPAVSKPALKLIEQPVVVHSFSGDLDSFPNDYLTNPLDPLGQVYNTFPSLGDNFRETHSNIWSSSEFYDTANQFFEMFVNTDDCEDIFSHAC